MNCKEFQQKVLDAWAAGETTLLRAMNEHHAECARCQTYYREQSALFSSIGTALDAIVNSPVPPSLLPMVRNQIHATAKTRRSGLYGWVFAGVVCSLACAVLVVRLGRAPATHDSSPLAKPKVASVVIPDVSTLGPQDRAKVASPTAQRRQVRITKGRGVSGSYHLEVIVDRREASELTHLADSVRKKPAWGQGFLRQAPAPPQEMTPLPPIEIAQLKVTALDEEKW